MVVDLSVVHDDRAAWPRHRLTAGLGQVDDAEPAVGEPDVAIGALPRAAIVRSPMGKEPPHDLKRRPEVGDRRAAKVANTGYAAHVGRLFLQAEVDVEPPGAAQRATQ